MSREAGGRGGVIVNVSSTCGVTCQGDMYATPAYTASKHAVTALTRTAGVRPGAPDVDSSASTLTVVCAAQVLGGQDGGVRGGRGSVLHRHALPGHLAGLEPRPRRAGSPRRQRPGQAVPDVSEEKCGEMTVSVVCSLLIHPSQPGRGRPQDIQHLQQSVRLNLVDPTRNDAAFQCS